METKQRLSVSIDPHLLDAGRAAIAEGRSESMSAWVNAALEKQATHERRLDALDAFFAAYEEEHGAFTDEEMADARRHFSERAIVVRGAVTGGSGRPGGRAL